MNAKRPPYQPCDANQMELVLPPPGRGEAPGPYAVEVEAFAAAADKTGPAFCSAFMERVCEPSNIAQAMAAVMANKGAPGIDGMAVQALPGYLEARWPGIARELLEGVYRPQPVRRVSIPKPGGGERRLGIPTVLDRMIQQALLQRLQPEWDATFSEHSYGFRPGRSAQQAVMRAQALVLAGHSHVVDIDLAKFFDRVNHDRLMAKVSQRIADRRVVRLIRAFLAAGVLDNGVIETSREGAPQGGPLSPLLSNLVLDELDRELERRGHAFVRYADDCNVYVKSAKAARRVMAGLARFIETRLKLQVNAEKSAAARPWQRSFLGYTLTEEPEPRRAIAGKALARFKDRVRELTGRQRGIPLERMIGELAPFLRGWVGYFKLTQCQELGSLDGWVRRRLRCLVWTQWKTQRRRYAELLKRKVPRDTAGYAVFRPKGPWRRSRSQAMHRAFTNARFRQLGLIPMTQLANA